jgi:hypothetical protein
MLKNKINFTVKLIMSNLIPTQRTDKRKVTTMST